MKPVDFDLHRPSTLTQTLDLLTSFGDEARVLAGGQSLVPLLNFRLARPAHVIDIGLLPALDGVRTQGPMVTLGAMVRQSDAERSPVIAEHCPLLAAALPWIAHPPIRARGTIGGSLAHADPAAELPAVAVALGATLVAARSVPSQTSGGAAGSTAAVSTRAVPAAQFYQGYLTTALAPEELLTEIRFPAAAPRTGAAFAEVARRRGDFALVGCAAQVTLSGALVADARICLSGVAGVPVRAAAAEDRLRGRPLDDGLARAAAEVATGAVAEVAAEVAAGLSPPDDLHASSDYRRHLAEVLIRRTVIQAHQRAREQLPRPAAQPSPRACSSTTGSPRLIPSLGLPEDLPFAVEPGPPLTRITQQNPDINSGVGVLIICAGSDPAARIGTIAPVYGSPGVASRFGGTRKVCRAADVLTGGARDHSSTEPRQRCRGSARRGK